MSASLPENGAFTAPYNVANPPATVVAARPAPFKIPLTALSLQDWP